MKIVKEFKEFVMRGNVMDLAVGVIIGGAFGAIVTSLTDDIISPVLGIFGGMDFSDLSVEVNGANIMYGKFITAIINFLIMALIIFLMVKGINKIMSLGKKKEEEPAPTTKVCPFCCTEIDIKATRCPHCTSELPEIAEE
ncbi:MAG: large conductance mechanosensitive channel protein MscL [Ruminococcus sp.]|nr:large conductance mechanosensitive channel protein MscL [Ruminococcus sp.]